MEPTPPATAGEPGEPGEPAPASPSRLFDVRSVVAGVFVVYGVILAVVGLTADAASLAKSQGIAINLWTGLGCLALGIVFVVWMLARPARPE